MNDKKIVAIRSLRCPDHAFNIPPTVIGVQWFVGKRCNYDCSYCGPHIHDHVSPFINLETAFSFATTLTKNTFGKQINWAFTGGEPFIDPGFIPLLKVIKETSNVGQTNVITNGSLPLKTYMSASALLDGITISLHPERNEQEINETVNKIIELNKLTNTRISVNVMFITGKLNYFRQLIDKLKENNVGFILRKIEWTEKPQELYPFIKITEDKKSRELVSLDQQVSLKQQWNKQNLDPAQPRPQYYTDEELKFLVEANNTPPWVDAGVWYNDSSYRELNTDLLRAEFLNNFKNWICYAGVDQIQIDFDGSIYTGMCMNGGPIGHISDKNSVLLTEPRRCERSICICGPDISVRKARSTQYINHIT